MNIGGRLALLALLLSAAVVACTATPATEQASPTSSSVTPTSAAPTATATPSPQPTATATAQPMAPPSATVAAGTPTLRVAPLATGGEYLVGPADLALYTFTRDDPGVSRCADDCAVNWPPLLLTMDEQPTAGAGISGGLGTITRDDGGRQVTYDDAPLYYFAGDSSLTDTNGDGLGGVWELARPGSTAPADSGQPSRAPSTYGLDY